MSLASRIALSLAPLTTALGLGACEKAPPPPATPAAAATQTGEVELAPARPAAPAMPPAGASNGGALPAGHPPVDGMAPPVPAGAQVPPGHPPMGGGAPGAAGQMGPAGGSMGAAQAAEADVPLPLPLEGAGSVAELKGRLAKIKDTNLHGAFDEAFRKVFTVQRQLRDGKRADELLAPLATNPDPMVASLAERVLGYVRVNSGFDAEGAKTRYMKAIELDPQYGEAHYALAFVLAISDLGKGKEHFEKAMALGVPDTRGLRGQFYKD